MKKSRIEKIHSVVAQLMFVAAYPVVFHLAAIIGNANMHKPEKLGDMAFPLISLMIWVGLFIATICTWLMKRHSKQLADSKNMSIVKNKSENDDEEDEYIDDDELDEEELEKIVSGQDLVEEQEKEEKFNFEREQEKHRRQVETLQKKRNKTKNWVVYTTLTIVSLLIRLPMLGTFQRWDAGEYFYTVGTSVQDYTFTLPNFLYNFAVAYHLNYGFTSFIAIPLFLSPRSVIGITLWQILFSVLAVMALYRIFRIEFDFTRSKSAVAAMVIGNVPIFLGLTTYCTPDYYLVLFFIFALYFQAREWHILEVFCLVMMCFTKENAALVVLGYYGIRILCRFIFVNLTRARELKTFADKKYRDPMLDFDILDEGTEQLKAREEAAEKAFEQARIRKNQEGTSAQAAVDEIAQDMTADGAMKKSRVSFGSRIRLSLHTSDFWVALTVGIIFVVAMILKGANWADKVSASGAAPVTLSIEKPYIYLKIKQYLGSNFAWLIFVYFLVAFKNIIIERKWKNLKGSGWLVFGGICGALTFFMAFGLFFHVSPLERYNTFFAVGLAFITAIVMGVDIVSRSSYVFFGGILAVLLAIESFVTIDPVTKGFYKQVPIGEKTMNFESEQIAYFGDGLVTNYQYAWLDKAFDKLLDDIDYNGDTALYFPVKETGVESGVQFDGNGAYFRVGWFDEKKKRDYFDYNMTGWEEMNICAVSATNTWFPYDYLPYSKRLNKQYMTTRAYMCFVPYFEELGVSEERHLASISEYYYLGEEQEASAYRGTINYYPMVQRDGYIEGLDMGTVISEMKSLTANDEEIEDAAAGTTDASEDSDKAKSQVSSASSTVTTMIDDATAEAELNSRIEKLYNYRMADFLRVSEINEEGRIDIEPFDSVHLVVELYDSNGKQIRTMHDEEEFVVKVGVGELLPEVDEALLEMQSGEVREIEITVPDGYPELEIYSGQTVTVKLQPLYIACSLEYVIDDETRQQVYDDTVAEVTENFSRELEKQKLSAYIQENAEKLSDISAGSYESTSTVTTSASGGNAYGIVTSATASQLKVNSATLLDVQNYYYHYLEEISMTKEEFAENVLGATPEEYEMAMAIIAGMAD